MAKGKEKNINTHLPSINNINLSGGSTSYTGFLHYLHDHVMFLNNSKFFAGIVMIMLNIGSKFISIQFSKSTEEYLKYSVTKQLLVFAMAWMGTRDIYTALMLTAAFVILSDHLFNEESHLCVVPHDYRVLGKQVDTTVDGSVSDSEVAAALAIIERAKKEKKDELNKNMFMQFDLTKM